MNTARIAALALVASAAAAGIAAAQAPASPPPAGAPDGAALFANNCAACHQPKGEGIEGAFPKLAGNSFVSGDPKAVVLTLLNGRGGMPAFRNDLKDEELSAVISFVRSSWGNTAPPIPPASFAALRADEKTTIDRPIPAH